MSWRLQLLLLCMLFVVFLPGCGEVDLPTRVTAAPTIEVLDEGGDPLATATVPATGVGQAQPEATVTLATPIPTPAPWQIAVDAAVPGELVDAVQEVVEAHPDEFVWADGGEADVTLEVNGATGALATWVYAVAVPFATVADGFSLSDLQLAWRGEAGVPPLLTTDTAALLQQLWGDGQSATVSETELVGALWSRRPAWTLIPFHQLVPTLKVWSVDDVSPLSNTFDPAAYPFTVTFGFSGDAGALDAFLARWMGPDGNYSPEKLTRVAMTGVTALVRATAYQMEVRSITYPGEEVAPILQEADIAHVSNEVAFVPECPMPHYIGGTTFCSSPRYMELLQYLGIDVVEMTGNHVNDWGAGYIPYTLQLYDSAGMAFFGGGRNLEEARQPAIFEHNENIIVFLGCNPAGPAGAWAGEEWGGARPCDEQFVEQIRRYHESGAFVIVTQQYWESYHYAPTADQRDAFVALAAAGAGAVSGSQAHHVQGFGFEHGAFIHFGLGNLFFDQMDQLGTRQSFVDIYTVYENRLLNVTLWTGLIEDYSRPRLMTPDERADLLQTVFQASGW
jgi:hypothetical protein